LLNSDVCSSAAKATVRVHRSRVNRKFILVVVFVLGNNVLLILDKKVEQNVLPSLARLGIPQLS
jgi:hypothetical protein